MPGENRQYNWYVGIDVTAASTSVAVVTPDQPANQQFSIEQTDPDITSRATRLTTTAHRTDEVHTVREATGTYWMRLAQHLYQQGFAVSVVNPSQAYHYAQAELQRSKCDELDAQTLTRMAYQLRPDLWEPDSANYEELEQR